MNDIQPNVTKAITLNDIEFDGLEDWELVDLVTERWNNQDSVEDFVLRWLKYNGHEDVFAQIVHDKAKHRTGSQSVDYALIKEQEECLTRALEITHVTLYDLESRHHD